MKKGLGQIYLKMIEQDVRMAVAFEELKVICLKRH